MNKSKSHPKSAGRKSSGLYRRPFQLAARTVEELNQINLLTPLKRTEILIKWINENSRAIEVLTRKNILAAIAAQKKEG